MPHFAVVELASHFYHFKLAKLPQREPRVIPMLFAEERATCNAVSIGRVASSSPVKRLPLAGAIMQRTSHRQREAIQPGAKGKSIEPIVRDVNVGYRTISRTRSDDNAPQS